MNSIEVRNLSKTVAGTSVLQDVDLAVPAGAVFGLLGRNGAGKTTLFKLFLGLLLPDAGSITILGEHLTSTDVRRRLGYVAGSNVLPGWSTLGDVIELERRLRATWDDAGIERWRDTEGLAKSRRIAHLSDGQRRRFEIELAMAAHPELLLLDEPFTNLDPVAKNDVLGTLLEHSAATGATLVVSSHVLHDLERICTDVAFLIGGRIAQVVPVDELKESAAIGTRPNSLEEIGTELLRAGGVSR